MTDCWSQSVETLARAEHESAEDSYWAYEMNEASDGTLVEGSRALQRLKEFSDLRSNKELERDDALRQQFSLSLVEAGFDGSDGDLRWQCWDYALLTAAEIDDAELRDSTFRLLVDIGGVAFLSWSIDEQGRPDNHWVHHRISASTSSILQENGHPEAAEELLRLPETWR